MENKVLRERILDAFHKSLQWKDGEISGVAMSELEQRIDGILKSVSPLTSKESDEFKKLELKKAFDAGNDRGRFEMKEGDPNAFHSDYPDFETWHAEYNLKK